MIHNGAAEMATIKATFQMKTAERTNERSAGRVRQLGCSLLPSPISPGQSVKNASRAKKG
jgi:hypothetical protein